MKPSQSTPLVLGLITLACSGDPVDDSGASDEVPADRIEYYEVVGTGLWEGTWDFTSHMVALRHLQPSTSTIYEQFIGLGEEDGTTYELNASVDLETSSFTFAYADGSYEGSGVLHGEAWDWHGWESTSIATSDGSSVVSVDTKDDSGIVAHKTGYDAKGQEQWTMEEVLTPITEEEWLALQEGGD